MSGSSATSRDNWNVVALGGSISFEIESQPTVNADLIEHEGEHKRNIKYDFFSAGADNLFGKIKHANAELLRSSTGQNVIEPTSCSEGREIRNSCS